MLEMLENLEEEHEVMKETQRKVRVSLSFIVLFIISNKSFEFQLYYLKNYSKVLWNRVVRKLWMTNSADNPHDVFTPLMD